MKHITIERNGIATTYEIDTEEQRDIAAAALRDAGQIAAPVFVGTPGGRVERTGRYLYSATEDAPSMRVVALDNRGAEVANGAHDVLSDGNGGLAPEPAVYVLRR